MLKHLAFATAAVIALGGAAFAAPSAGQLKIVERIAGPDGGWDYATFDPAHRRLYVAHGDTITAVDVDSGKVTPKFAAAQKSHIALPLPGGDELLVTNGAANTATIVNTATGAVRATVPTGKKPDAALIEPTTGLGWVMNGGDGSITLVDTAAGKAVASIPVGGTLEFAVADGAGRVFVNIEDKGEIAVVDVKTRKVTARWPMAGCEEPSGLAYAAHAKLLIAACANNVGKAVSATSGKVTASLPIGSHPDAALYDAQRKLAYIPAGGDGTLTVIAISDAGAASVAGKVSTQVGARTGALDPKTGRLYLPTAEYAPAATPGGKPMIKPGSFKVLVLDR